MVEPDEFPDSCGDPGGFQLLPGTSVGSLSVTTHDSTLNSGSSSIIMFVETSSVIKHPLSISSPVTVIRKDFDVLLPFSSVKVILTKSFLFSYT